MKRAGNEEATPAPTPANLPETSAEQLVERIQSGETELFRQLVLKFQRPLFAYCRHMLGNREEAEDAVQEVFWLAYSRLNRFVRYDSFQAWLYTIAYRHCLNLLRRRQGWVRFLQRYRRSATEPAPRYDADLLLEELLDKLNATERHLIILRVLEDRSFEEIATMSNMKPAALRKKFERIKKKLKRERAKEETDHKEEPDHGHERTWTSVSR